VLSTAHDVADGRLFRLVEAMQRMGLAVEVIGRGDPSGGPPGADVRTRPRAGRFGRALDAVRLPLAARGRVLVTPVSYTHLRAHETVLDLVCRLRL
jgi:hypothetical protein